MYNLFQCRKRPRKCAGVFYQRDLGAVDETSPHSGQRPGVARMSYPQARHLLACCLSSFLIRIRQTCALHPHIAGTIALARTIIHHGIAIALTPSSNGVNGPGRAIAAPHPPATFPTATGCVFFTVGGVTISVGCSYFSSPISMNDFSPMTVVP